MVNLHIQLKVIDWNHRYWIYRSVIAGYLGKKSYMHFKLITVKKVFQNHFKNTVKNYVLKISSNISIRSSNLRVYSTLLTPDTWDWAKKLQTLHKFSWIRKKCNVFSEEILSPWSWFFSFSVLVTLKMIISWPFNLIPFKLPIGFQIWSHSRWSSADPCNNTQQSNFPPLYIWSLWFYLILCMGF